MSVTNITIPSQKPINQWSEEDVQTFLTANIASYSLKVRSIEILGGEEVGGRGLLQIGLNDLKEWGIPFGQRVNIVELINELKRPKGLSK